MANENTVTVAPHRYDKIGVLHCGVTEEGFVTVGGDVSNIAEGETVKFDRNKISVNRKGEEYTFAKYD